VRAVRVLSDIVKRWFVLPSGLLHAAPVGPKGAPPDRGVRRANHEASWSKTFRIGVLLVGRDLRVPVLRVGVDRESDQVS